MASSSSSPLSKYDVFLSFRGEDTRDNIVSHLVDALKTKKIETFIDDEKLKRGDEISPALISAIKQSKISIIIFSENYAESSWCLDELVKILECREALTQIVIPVFYKVDPKHVRIQTEKFGIAFDKLLTKYQIRPVIIFSQNIAPSKSGKEQIWRNALKRAANLSGFHSFNIGSEATLVRSIVADVLEKLKNSSNNACDDKGLIGMTSRIEKIMHLLDIESPEIRMVGIWGMGGIGKTTVVGQVFTKISSNFDSCCFLRDVREQVNKQDLPSIRDKLISELLKDNKLEIHTPRIGDASIKGRLSRTKVLVVLDNVDSSSLLEVLIGACGTELFGPGSRVMVTTRDKHVLDAHDITYIYDMEMLDDNEALELFGFYAFRQNQQIELYLEFSKEIVKYAQGFPLALKVLGSSIRGKTDIRDWEGALRKLKKVSNMEILGVLKTSYDSLNDEEKEIFLDISCFFNGGDVDRVRNVLDGCYVSLHSGMEVLVDKSLISIISREKDLIYNSDEICSIDVVEMHDLVQEMGCNIVIGESREIGSRSRLWRAPDVYDVLTRNTGTDKIKGIIFDVRGVKQMNLDPQAFAKMHNLKFLKIIESYLDVSKIQFPNGLESLPEGLRYLYWIKYPLEYLPPTFNPTNLVQLHLRFSRLKRLWSGTHDLFRLKVLSLEFCKSLIETPDLSSAVNLEELKLTYNDVLDNFSSSIKHLSSLKYLNLAYCMSFTKISSFLPHLKNLTHLNLRNCHRFTNISYIQYLKNLTHLNFSNCHLLTEIPPSIHHLKNLIYLDLDGCEGLNDIPSCIQHLKNLTYLSVNFCKGLKEIPSSIQRLHSLSHFHMGSCTKITKLPNLPHNIKFLTIDGILIEVYSPLTHHPLRLLTNLVELVLWKCIGHQQSSIFLEQIKVLIPHGCKIIRRN